MVEVIWLGLACFELKGTKKTVVVDPFKEIGLPEPSVKADIILCSHGHFDHNNAEPLMKKDSTVLEGFVGSKKIGDVTVKGLATFHDNVNGTSRGQNSVYIINLDSFKFCHLGDIGHDLTVYQTKEIGEVDVLLIPIGGFFTIDASIATRIMEKVKPKIIVPMHYRIPGLSSLFDVISGLDEFLIGKANVKKLDKPSFTVEKANLPYEPIIIVPKLR